MADGTEHTGHAIRLFVGSSDRSTKNQRAHTPQYAHSSRPVDCVLPKATCPLFLRPCPMAVVLSR